MVNRRDKFFELGEVPLNDPDELASEESMALSMEDDEMGVVPSLIEDQYAI